jgi:hypothetical protein
MTVADLITILQGYDSSAPVKILGPVDQGGLWESFEPAFEFTGKQLHIAAGCPDYRRAMSEPKRTAKPKS